MAYKALDVANYIVKYCIKKGISLSNLKLQKMMYYLQAQFLINGQGQLFSDKIEAWKLGPVVPDVYHKYKYFGSDNIYEVPKELNIEIDNYGKIEFVNREPDIIEFPREIENIVDFSINKLGQRSEWDLVDLTHNQYLWKDHENDIRNGVKHIEYDLNEMKQFFEDHPEELKKAYGQC